MRRFRVTADSAFEQVMLGCADPVRTGRWITPAILRAYGDLHRLGWAHSIEVWEEERLVGGLYGLAIGGLFAGESMFHRVTDASKAALASLAEILVTEGDSRRLIDVQWVTPHLATCLLYTSDAADARSRVDLGGRRILQKKKKKTLQSRSKGEARARANS